MDKNPPTVLGSDDTHIILRELRELREDLARHEQMVRKISVFIEQQLEHSQNPSTQGATSVPSATVSSAWMPAGETGDMIGPIQGSLKIRTVKPQPIKQVDIVTTLRNTWLGQFYIRHLKHFVVVRWIAHWLWRNGYPLYVNHIATHLSSRKEKRWRPLIKLSEIVKNSGAITYKLADAAVVHTPEPKVFPVDAQSYLKTPHDKYRFPEIYVAVIKNAVTYGGTNLVLAGDEVICHDLYDFERDYTSEELHGRTLVDPKCRRIRWLLSDDVPESIPVAATFVDACASNYAHWLTEVLPRIILFCADDRFSGIPIVINDGLHKNIMESLFVVAGAGREIITLPIGRALIVNELYLTSVAGYVPFERREDRLSGHSHGIFSPFAFGILRKNLRVLGQKYDKKAWPEKIILRRNSGVRRVANATEIEKLLVAQGYVIVEPEKLSFLEQVGLFSSVKIILASSGAAVANIIFCSPASQIFIMISKQPSTSYWYWQNMATASGNIVRYILGETVVGSGQSIHDDFYISPEEVLKALN